MNNYEQGFIDFCKQAGVDANELVKAAADPVTEFLPSLVGNLGTALGGNIVGGPVRGAILSNVAQGGSTLTGLLTPPDEARKKELGTQSAARAMIPLQYGHNIGQRRRGVAEESRALGAKSPYANLIAEQLGTGSSVLAPTLLAGLIGGGIGGEDGAIAGAGLAGGATSIVSTIAAIAAGISKRRTAEEQAKVDSSTGRAVAKYFVPGMAMYDYFKRIGVSRDWSEDKSLKDKKKKKDK